jgi:hypothetical protein
MEFAVAEKQKAGRPPKGEFSGLTAPLTIRMPTDMRKELEAAAYKSGKSVTQELLRRLQGSFHRERDKSRDPGLQAVCFLIAKAAESVAGLKSYFRPDLPRPLWRTDRSTFLAFKLTVAKLLDLLEPEGKAETPLTVEATGAALRKLKPNVKVPPELIEYIAKAHASPEALANSSFLSIWSALLRPVSLSEDPERQALLRIVPNLRSEWDQEFYGMSDARRDLGIKLEGEKP